MAIPPDTARIVFSGTMPNGEIWSTGFWVHGSVPTSAGEANALAELAFFQFSAADTSGSMTITLETLFNSSTVWTQVNAYCYPTGGPTATYVGRYDIPSPPIGSNSAHNPNQVAFCLTLRSGLSGRSRRGRMFLPATGAPMETDGQLSQSRLASLTNAWALGFSDWNAASTPKIVIVSQRLDAFTPVTTVTMDSRADVQRSRAKSETILRNSIVALT